MNKMRNLVRCLAAVAVVLALAGVPALAARKGDKLYKDGKLAEVKKQWETALDFYEKAMLEDPSNVAYQMAARRVRFQAGQLHVNNGQKMRAAGQLNEALLEFQKAYSIDPSSIIAEQEIRRTLEMINREKKTPNEKDKGLTPAEEEKKEIEERIDSLEGPPELKPISHTPITLKMSNQPPRILFETIAKLAGINVIFDSEYQPTGRNFFVDLTNATLEQALDFVAIQTKSFWKPLSGNTIFVTQDNVTKRRDYEDMVVKTFYLTNTTTVQELQEIATAVRAVTEVRRLFTYNGQNVIIIRGTVDQVALAEKLIHDLDKPKSEVVVDVVVMEISKTLSRTLGAGLAFGGSPGVNLPVNFTPRNPVLSGNTSTPSTGTPGTNNGAQIPTTQTPGTGTPTSRAISLAQVGHISTNDFSITLPGAIFQALLSNREGRVLQAPQVRAVELQKASLRLGDKIPFASGSFQPGFGAVGAGVSPLVSTQFQFAEVGVNVDIVPKVHGPKEVSLHVELELSTVRERIDIGGLQQPVIGQRKIIHDIRMREGEVNLLGGLQSLTDTLTENGVPGVHNIPILKWILGSSEVKEKTETELVIFLVPHIIRSPEITPSNLRGISAGSDATVRLHYAPREDESEAATPQAPPAPKPVPAAPKTPAAAPPAVVPTPAPAPPKATPAPAAPVPTPAPHTPATPPAAPAPAAPPPAENKPPAPPAAPPAKPAELSFAPAKLHGKVNQNVTVVLQVNHGSDLFSAPMRVKYDPKVLKLTEVVRGNALSPDGQKLNFMPVINSELGEARVEMSRLPGSGGVNSSGPLVMFRFQGVGKGSSQVTLEEFGLRTSRNLPIPASLPAASVTME